MWPDVWRDWTIYLRFPLGRSRWALSWIQWPVRKKDGGSPGKGMVVQLLHVFAADDSSHVLVDFWFWFCVLMRGLLLFAIGFSRDWRWNCEFIDFRLTVSSSISKCSETFKSCEIFELQKNLQKHVHWTVPVCSREVTYFLFLNDVQKHIPCNLLNNL